MRSNFSIWGADLREDLRHASRQFRQNPSFTLVAVLTLTVGICAVTTPFSVINGALLRPPFPESERLQGIALRNPAWPPERDQRLTTADLTELQRTQETCVGLAGFNTYRWMNVTISGASLPLSGVSVSPNFFSLLGIAPAFGRDFRPADAQPGADLVALISHALARKHFGSAEQGIGQTLRIEGRVTTVIGIMPPRFAFPRHEEIWLPLLPESAQPAGRGQAVSVLARMKPGVTPEQVRSDLTRIAAALARAFPETNREATSVTVNPLLAGIVGDMRGMLVAMLVAAGGVLAISCLNVMNLQFARAAVRVRELAIRGALGATRGRLLRLALMEGLLLSIAGGLAGVALAQYSVRLFHDAMAKLPFGGAPGWVNLTVDFTVLGFVFGVITLTLLASSLAPALFASRVDANAVLQAGARGQSNRHVARIGRTLVTIQIGLGCALLIASLLQVKSIRRHAAQDYGFDTEVIAGARVSLDTGYVTSEARRAFGLRLLHDLRSNPEFAAAALSSRSLMIMGGWPARVQRELSRPAPEDTGAATFLEYVSDGYRSVLNLRLVAGREFEPNERERHGPTALVNGTFVRRHFGAVNPLGQRIRILREGSASAEWRTIVGVLPDTHLQGPYERRLDGPGVFLPLEEMPVPFPTVLVRGRATSAVTTEALRRAVQKVDPDLTLYGLGTAEERLLAVNGEARAIAALFTAFAIAAVLLAGVGLFAVTSFTVAARRREFGIRIALGADATRITSVVLREGGRQYLFGSLGGIVLALALAQLGETRWEDFLYHVSPRDPAIYGSVLVLLAAVLGLACWLPARRATRVDPIEALRAE